MNNKQSKKIISIRTRLFLQVGAVVVVAVLLILSLNNFLLPTIYAKNEKRSMIDVKNEISRLLKLYNNNIKCMIEDLM